MNFTNATEAEDAAKTVLLTCMASPHVKIKVVEG